MGHYEYDLALECKKAMLYSFLQVHMYLIQLTSYSVGNIYD